MNLRDIFVGEGLCPSRPADAACPLPGGRGRTPPLHTLTTDAAHRHVNNVVGRDAHIAPPYNAFLPTAALHERQRRKSEVDSSYKTTTSMFCERVVDGRKFTTQNSAGGFLNRRFKWCFCLLLSPRTKVGRSAERNILIPTIPQKLPFYSRTMANVRHITSAAPAAFKTRAHSPSVAPVVQISSTSSKRFPANCSGDTAS